jgi:hypothetical protein
MEGVHGFQETAGQMDGRCLGCVIVEAVCADGIITFFRFFHEASKDSICRPHIPMCIADGLGR